MKKKIVVATFALFAGCMLSVSCGGNSDSSKNTSDSSKNTSDSSKNTSDSSKSNRSVVESDSNDEIEQTINIGGNIGKYPVMMTMHIAPDHKVTGAYYYRRKGRGNYLYVKGIKDDNRITLDEFTKEGLHTATFEGKLENGVFKGKFDSWSGHYEYLLKPVEMENIAFSNIDFDAFDSDSPLYGESQRSQGGYYSNAQDTWNDIEREARQKWDKTQREAQQKWNDVQREAQERWDDIQKRADDAWDF